MKIDVIENMLAQDKPLELIAERFGVSERQVIEFIAENVQVSLDGFSSGRAEFEGEDRLIAAREAYLVSLLEDEYEIEED